MVKFHMDAVVGKLKDVKKGISITKYILGAATILITVLAIPLIRLILQADGMWSTAATVIYWLAITRSGFSVALYPWWLATAKSLVYYHRLRQYSNSIIAVSLVLAILRCILAPVKPNRYEDMSATTVQFQVVSTMYWVSVLAGTFMVIPVGIRRMRLFQARSPILYIMVIPFVLVMITSVLISEWSGNSFYVSYSPVMIIVLFAFALLAEKHQDNNSVFDESYIMVVGE